MIQDIPKSVILDLAAQAGSNILLAKFEHGVYYQYLPGIYSSYPASKLLKVAVEAVGLRCLSLARNEGQLMIKARENHAMALQTAKRQIPDLTYRVTPYDTVASILLLALFAVMSSDSLMAQDVWAKHVDGAFAVFASWESQQDFIPASTLATQNLLGHIINCVQLSCLQRREPLPANIERTYQYLPHNSMQARLHSIIDGLALPSLELSEENQNTSARLQELCSLDADASSALKFLESSQPFKIVSGRGSRHNEPVCHEYLSHRSAQAWNFVRVLRLMINEELLTLLTRTSKAEDQSDDSGIWHPLDIQKSWWQAFSTTSALNFDIYASVPVWLRGRSHVENEHEKISAPVRSDNLHWAHSLIWPLAMAQASPYTSGTLLALIDDTIQSLWQATTFPGATGPEKQRVGGLELKDWYAKPTHQAVNYLT